HISQYLLFFERCRYAEYTEDDSFVGKLANYATMEFLADMSALYENRSSARVADVSSVLYRDVVLWTFFFLFAVSEDRDLTEAKRFSVLRDALSRATKERTRSERFAENLVQQSGWEKAI